MNSRLVSTLTVLLIALTWPDWSGAKEVQVSKGKRGSVASDSTDQGSEDEEDIDPQDVKTGSKQANGKRGLGPRSPWLGAEVAYSLNGGSATDNFNAAGRTKLEVLGDETTARGMYVLGNVSRLKADADTDDERKEEKFKLSELQQSAQGIHMAVVPFRFWGDATKNSRTIWATAGWKMNALKDPSDSLIYLHQGRLGLGVEFTGLRGKFSQLPASISLEPTVALFSKDKYEQIFGESKSALWMADLTVVIPAGAGRGMLFELLSTVGQRPDFKVGLLLTSSDETTKNPKK